MVLRRFLYLDAELTGEFLAQVEGGRFSEEQQTSRGEQGRELGGSVGGGGISARAGRSGSTHDERSRTVEQTPESEFQRLTDALGDGIQFLEAFDDEIWQSIRRGEILEIEAEVTVATMHKFVEAAGAVEPMLALGEAFGEAVEIDDETRQMFQAMRSLGQMAPKVPVLARPAGAARFTFVTSLEPDKLRVDTGELEGEATLVAKVQRKLRRGDQYSFLDSLPILSALPRQQRKEALRELENTDDMPDMVITPPAAVVTPIAIFR